MPLQSPSCLAVDPPTRAVRLGRPQYDLDRRADGSVLLRARETLGPYPARMTDKLVEGAGRHPDRTLFAARGGDGAWVSITYGEALQTARSIGEALLRRGLSAERPVAILSGNDLDHAMLAFGCMFAGVPYAPVSPAYSLISADFAKLRHIAGLLTPGLMFAADGRAFERAIAAAFPGDVEIVVSRNPPSARRCTGFSDLANTEATSAIDAAHGRAGPDTIVKFLFTSGSTGEPKAVINTNRMWCANQEMLRAGLAFVQDEPPVIVDWSPWHHTAGGNHDIGLVLYNGGTFYIDDGKPTPAAIGETVRTLREISPTWYFNVPKGFEALLPYLRSDDALRRTFFSRLRVLWFAGAGIAQHVFDEVQQLAVETCGERILFLTGFGSTETAPYALARTWHSGHAGNVGLPAIGLDMKLVPAEGRLEGRLRGPNITPGYWRRPELTAAAFDEDGFYRLGDAFRFDDPDDVSKGLLFEGRTAENFKLDTGTWVQVGPLRAQVIAHFAPLVRDVVIAGADRNDVAALMLPDVEACRALAGMPKSASLAEVAAAPAVREALRERLCSLAKASTGSSNLIRRTMWLLDPLSLDTGEMTDKGSINQRLVIRNRAAMIERLYAAQPDDDVISIDASP
ncbi:MAG: feruloyl-CoA synthase [Xanthobacteraceae bacterium]|nr:feruloyl-CoA synthase [Xanthobacteraceae bacterium]